MKIGTVTNSSTRIPKIMVLKLENNGKMDKYPPNDPRPQKIESCQINLKSGMNTKTDTGNPKIKIPKSYSNGNNT